MQKRLISHNCYPPPPPRLHHRKRVLNAEEMHLHHFGPHLHPKAVAVGSSCRVAWVSAASSMAFLRALGGSAVRLIISACCSHGRPFSNYDPDYPQSFVTSTIGAMPVISQQILSAADG